MNLNTPMNKSRSLKFEIITDHQHLDVPNQNLVNTPSSKSK